MLVSQKRALSDEESRKILNYHKDKEDTDRSMKGRKGGEEEEETRHLL